MKYILATKIYAPSTRPYHIGRHRLVKRIAKGLYGKLTLISAPAGFGKSMLMSEFIMGLHKKPEGDEHRSIAWISLDKDDNNPSRFLTYLCSSLAGCGVFSQSFVESAEQIISTPNVPSPDVLAVMINEMTSVGRKVILFLDDFHFIESPEIFKLVMFLIEHSPDCFHLVIATRDNPPMQLNRLRARGQLNEIGVAELRFETEEISSLLMQINAHEMNENERRSIEIRSEGWITGILLALMTVEKHSIQNKNRYALDYLMSEVLSELSEEVRGFLIQTSFLNRFCRDLCDFICGNGNGEAPLDQLLKSNLFLFNLDGEGRWYRYHHLFRELLINQFGELPEDEKKALHRKAGLWFSEMELTEEAIEHFIAAEDWNRASDILERWGTNGTSQSVLLLKWLDYIPEEILLSKADLCILKSWNRFIGGRAEEAVKYLDSADGLISSLEMPASEANRIKGRSLVIKAFIKSYEGNLKKTIENASEARIILPDEDKIWRAIASIALGDAVGMSGNMVKALEKRFEALDDCEKAGNLYLILLSAVKLAVTLRMRGELSQVRQLCLKYLSIAEYRHFTGLPIVGWLKAITAEILAETGDLEKAIDLGVEAVEQTLISDDVAMHSWSMLCLVRIRFMADEHKEAEFIIQDLEEVIFERRVPPFIASSVSAWKIRILLRSGRIEEAMEQCRKRNLSADNVINSFNALEYISFARMLLEKNQYDECDALLTKLQVLSREGRWVFREIEILLIRTIQLLKSADSEEAEVPLEKALFMGQSHGFASIFLSEGEELKPLLLKMIDNSELADFVKDLLLLKAEKVNEPALEMVEPLSVREKEVLQCLSEGLSRQQIAQKLYLSPHTIKAHLRNIYGKLQVNSATQAVAEARRYDLIN